MSAANGRMAASGLVGALTSLFTTAATTLINDPSLRPIIAIMAGMTASIVAFEVLSWFVLYRLGRARVMIGRLIPVIQATQQEVIHALTQQKALMQQNNAPAASLRVIEKMQIDSSEELAKTLLELQRKSLELIREVGSI